MCLHLPFPAGTKAQPFPEEAGMEACSRRAPYLHPFGRHRCAEFAEALGSARAPVQPAPDATPTTLPAGHPRHPVGSISPSGAWFLWLAVRQWFPATEEHWAGLLLLQYPAKAAGAAAEPAPLGMQGADVCILFCTSLTTRRPLSPARRRALRGIPLPPGCSAQFSPAC